MQSSFAHVEIRHLVATSKGMKKEEVLYIFYFQDYYKLNGQGRILYCFRCQTLFKFH